MCRSRMLMQKNDHHVPLGGASGSHTTPGSSGRSLRILKPATYEEFSQNSCAFSTMALNCVDTCVKPFSFSIEYCINWDMRCLMQLSAQSISLREKQHLPGIHHVLYSAISISWEDTQEYFVPYIFRQVFVRHQLLMQVRDRLCFSLVVL